MLRVAVKRIQSRVCFVYIIFIFVKRCIVCLFVKLQVSVVNVGTPFDKVGVNVIGCRLILGRVFLFSYLTASPILCPDYDALAFHT